MTPDQQTPRPPAPMPLVLFTRWESILDLRSGTEVGCEALLRARQGPRLWGPAVLFGAHSPLGTLAQADQVARTVHTASYSRRLRPRAAFFLNVFPETAATDAQHIGALGLLLSAHGVAPWEVVIEVSERDTASTETWQQAVAAYRRLGCRIAVDDFGATEAGATLVGALRPDIVKIDRSWLRAGYRFNGRERSALSRAVARGATVCVEGIESPADLVQARALGATWGQGHGMAALFGADQGIAVAA